MFILYSAGCPGQTCTHNSDSTLQMATLQLKYNQYHALKDNTAKPVFQTVSCCHLHENIYHLCTSYIPNQTIYEIYSRTYKYST